ncbi:glycosyltransferase [Cyanobium sp. Aljojuca 7D2]|uniref:glycosyltransferase n=1 Tax=Cyanobium sp. Aljojuca 7D2 TaxID=2823698 RepID=UPI0020CD51F7|nr:glycosyltransferase [Cyanobium sp. Aljojuca 7D2]MCP9890272.1 glycosyltransferase [Cyanobium sp. Aljojuca 7D2]
MKPLRLLHIASTLAPSAGGPTRVLQDLAKAQVAAGHSVTICTTDRDYPADRCLPICYFEKAFPVPIHVQSFSVQYVPLLVSLGMARWLQKEMHAFDLIEIHGLYRFPVSFAAYQAKKCKKPYIIRPHGSLDPYLYARSSVGKLAFKRIYERCFDLPNLNGASAIHFTAIEERERTAFLNLRAPSFVIPNGLDWSRYQQLPPSGWLRARLGLADQPLVLFLGRLHFKKGLDLLIPAFDALRRSTPDVQLVIAGPENDNYGHQVRGWVQERGLGSSVHFIGALEGDDTLKAYVDADVFALPSYTENFGMTVIEALACSLPVVISDQVNIHAEVSGADAGIVTRCDVAEVAQALQALLTDPRRRHAMGLAGRRLVESQYTWPPIVEELTKQYEAVIARSSRGNPRVLAGGLATGETT